MKGDSSGLQRYSSIEGLTEKSRSGSLIFNFMHSLSLTDQGEEGGKDGDIPEVNIDCSLRGWEQLNVKLIG